VPKKFHLGWFTYFTPPVWQGPWPGNEAQSWTDGAFYVDLAKAVERACFDYVLFEDSVSVDDTYGGSYESSLKHAVGAPKLDPILLAPLMAQATTRVGLVTTVSTSFCPPFSLARAMSTLDHLSHGRAGWNIVTSSSHRAAQNYGLDEHYEHSERYDMAEEFTDLAIELWNSWEPDALVADPERNIYVDHTKVHAIDFVGKYFKCRGPLNTPPSPQGRPVLCQAGSSPRGRDFAAKYAETIITVPTGLQQMKSFREDIHARMDRYGRKPDSCKILFVVEPIVAATEEEARGIYSRMMEPTPENVEAGLSGMSSVTDIDFSRYPLDEPLPADLTTNGHKSSLANFYGYGETLRDVAVTWLYHYVDSTLVGTPEQVARRMTEVMECVGGDGFLVHGRMTRQYISAICDGLVPALQRVGSTRTSYTYEHFRENLMEF
jgi:long-chain alkane monooxygenase